MTEGRLTVQDVVAAGACAWGIRAWFTARREQLPPGLTFRSFMRHGMTVAEARSFNDAHLNRALELKVARSGE